MLDKPIVLDTEYVLPEPYIILLNNNKNLIFKEKNSLNSVQFIKEVCSGDNLMFGTNGIGGVGISFGYYKWVNSLSDKFSQQPLVDKFLYNWWNFLEKEYTISTDCVWSIKCVSKTVYLIPDLNEINTPLKYINYLNVITSPTPNLREVSHTAQNPQYSHTNTEYSLDTKNYQRSNKIKKTVSVCDSIEHAPYIEVWNIENKYFLKTGFRSSLHNYTTHDVLLEIEALLRFDFMDLKGVDNMYINIENNTVDICYIFDLDNLDIYGDYLKRLPFVMI